MRKPAIKIARVLFGIVLLAATLMGLRIALYPQTVTQGSYDCAIVLGAAVHGAEPSPVFQARIDHAVTLFQSGIVTHLVFTGGTGAGKAIAESEAGRQSAIRQGVPSTAIFIESKSKTTLQNLTEAHQVMAARQLKTAILVSDPLHLRRACSMAEDIGIQATSSATPTTRYTSWSTQIPFLLREVYFTFHYWVFRQ
ncbi:YdcF family protein [Prosthecobacter sp. SYSU 5D2]|uniref:YdcF family protein n=1 Tax=Prosthecobacter sp. SYSU 5D2 TaxID=3134134 RepID=UPI0031FF211D